MNTVATKRAFLKAVNEARKNGARMSAIAGMSEISVRTIQRWQKDTTFDRRKGSRRHIPHKLTEKERRKILETACSREFINNYPPEITAILADRGIYLASESSFYRVLKENRLLSHRRRSKAPGRREKPRLKATGPDQVYSWDITWLKSSVSGMYYYLYFVVDIFSRKIVHWEVHDRESGEIAANMLRKISAKKVIRGLKLHSDNGAPMKAYTMLAMMQALNITPSFSRPRVSTDNPYSESLFKTMKYRPFYPAYFNAIDEAVQWVKEFVYWYNRQHLHSGISFVTPDDRHFGKDIEKLKKRRDTYRTAFLNNPARWSRSPKEWKRQDVVYINPIMEEEKLKKVC